ncbi:MAG: hypothetical protein JF606_17515 [Burkholderiales bacterium]|nr:hypothetical protein [Burkholderiales bacterium]
MSNIIRTRVPRQDSEALAARARRIHDSDEQVPATPYDRRNAVLAQVTGARASCLRKEPALRDTDPQTKHLADTIRTRWPRLNSETLAAWACRIHGSDEEVPAMHYDRRIAELAQVTGAREDNLRQQPALRDTDPQMAHLADTIRTQVPRRNSEALVAWARRIHDNVEQVPAMHYDQRIAVLAQVTGAREGDLRQEPALRDTNPQMAQLVDAIRTLVPRQDREGPTAWARRIHESNEQVRAMLYDRRIAVLAQVTGATGGALRKVPALRDPNPQMKHLADTIRTRVPRRYLETLLAWARRIHESDAQVHAMPSVQLIAVLAQVTGVREIDLRQEPALRDTDPQMKHLADTIRTQVPRQDSEALAAWARRIHDNVQQVRAMVYRSRIAVLAQVTGAREGDLRQDPALRDTDPQMAQLVETIRTLVPRQDREGPTAWARRIHESNEQVRTMLYDRRIAVLAQVTGARECNLRRETSLKDTDPL